MSLAPSDLIVQRRLHACALCVLWYVRCFTTALQARAQEKAGFIAALNILLAWLAKSGLYNPKFVSPLLRFTVQPTSGVLEPVGRVLREWHLWGSRVE